MATMESQSVSSIDIDVGPSRSAWTPSEVKLLLSLYLQNKDLLEEKHCQASTEKKKNMKWKEMALRHDP